MSGPKSHSKKWWSWDLTSGLSSPRALPTKLKYHPSLTTNLANEF